MQQSCSEEQVFAVCDMSISSLDCPSTGRFVPRGIDNLGVESDILAKIQNLVDVCEVPPQLLVAREALRKVPVSVDLWDVELV
jgi:hypothetical protein